VTGRPGSSFSTSVTAASSDSNLGGDPSPGTHHRTDQRRQSDEGADICVGDRLERGGIRKGSWDARQRDVVIQAGIEGLRPAADKLDPQIGRNVFAARRRRRVLDEGCCDRRGSEQQRRVRCCTICVAG
jgi:hypothetical protein